VSRPGYVRIANDIGASEEALELPDGRYLSSLGLFILCLGYCDRQLTDGAIPGRALSRAIAPGIECRTEVAELERVGLLVREPGGWRIPGYLKWQRSREQIEAASENASKAASARWGTASGNAKRNAKRNAKELDRQTEETEETVKPVLSDSSESAPPTERTPPATISASRNGDWQQRADAVLAGTDFPSDYVQLAELLAAENKTGKTALSRVVRTLYEPLLDVEHEVGADAMRAGLRAAITKGAPNATYVRKAAVSHTERPDSVAVTSRGIDRSDYDDFLNGGEP
jgi:hypothetical protein